MPLGPEPVITARHPQGPTGFGGLAALVSDVSADVAAVPEPPPKSSGSAAAAVARGPIPIKQRGRTPEWARGMIVVTTGIVGMMIMFAWCSGEPRSNVVTPSSTVTPSPYVPGPGAASGPPFAVDRPGPEKSQGQDGPGALRHVDGADRLLEDVRAAANKYRLPEDLLVAVIAVESNFDTRAVSPDGRIGLMQLSPELAKRMFVNDPWDPAQNIEGGARYLRTLANEFGGDPVAALAAYKAGPEAVRNAGGRVPSEPGTRGYVRKVVEVWKALGSRKERGSASGVIAAARTVATVVAGGTTVARANETKPPVGSGRALSADEVRYCVFENERIDRMKPLASDNSRIDTFNTYVSDYNSRCSNFRYRRGILEQIRREATERSDDLDTEARARFR